MKTTSTTWTGRLVRMVWPTAAFCLAASRIFAASGDENWDSRFDALGVNGFFSSVSAIAVSGNDVYVGGQFNSVGGVAAANIAKWNGTSWSPLGNGVDFSVLAITVIGSNVYAGGSFTNAGGLGIKYIARWNGSQWSAVGGGVDATVFALATDGTNLYAGGSFGTAGGATANANAVARWNGTSWSPLAGPLGNGAGGAVFAITVVGPDVYIGGNFPVVGLTLGVNNGIAARGIARWTGADWAALGTGVTGLDYRVQSIAALGTDIYVGGNFTAAGGIATKSIAKWGPSGWSSIGGINGYFGEVESVSVSAGKVYAVGTFSSAGGIAAVNVAQWNGTAWSALGRGIGDDFSYGVASAATATELYVGGNFTTAGGKTSRFLGRYAFPTSAGPSITTQPTSVAANAGQTVNLNVAASGATAVSYQWQKNGAALVGSTAATLTLANLQPANAGLYAAVATSGGATTSELAIVGVSSASKVIGAGSEIAQNIFVASNGNTFDQVLLDGAAATVTADASLNQITRTSFVDLTDDIVQVEMSGAGSLSLVLDNPSGPALPANYNQTVSYMKGHVGLVVTGANETTNIAVFSVGRITAVNQALFKTGTTYDGFADLAFIAISSTNGKFGGVRTANASYSATRGPTGLYAPGVQFLGPVFLGDINAFDTAVPMLVVGSAADSRITGGDLLQANGQPVKVSGLTQLKFVAGTTSHGNPLVAQNNRAVLLQNGTDVTAQIVVNPTP
jgi:hypothetical protein